MFLSPDRDGNFLTSIDLSEIHLNCIWTLKGTKVSLKEWYLKLGITNKTYLQPKVDKNMGSQFNFFPGHEKTEEWNVFWLPSIVRICDGQDTNNCFTICYLSCRPIQLRQPLVEIILIFSHPLYIQLVLSNKKVFFVVVLTLWNTLPLEIKLVSTLLQLINKLKTCSFIFTFDASRWYPSTTQGHRFTHSGLFQLYLSNLIAI